MPHGLDHIVHAVRDLDAAAEFYGRAGFAVGARNRHPWGTHNRIVQLKNCYIEILEVAEPEKIVPHGARSFSFGAFNRDFLASHQGFSMLILNSSNAADDARAFEAAGIGGYDVFDFAREGAKPEGTPVKRWRSRWFLPAIRPRRIWVLRRASTISRRIFGTRHFKSTPMARKPWPAWRWSPTIRPTITSS